MGNDFHMLIPGYLHEKHNQYVKKYTGQQRQHKTNIMRNKNIKLLNGNSEEEYIDINLIHSELLKGYIIIEILTSNQIIEHSLDFICKGV